MSSASLSLPELTAEFLAFHKPLVSAQGYGSLEFLTKKLVRWLVEQELDPQEVSIQDASAYMAQWEERVTGGGKAYATGTVLNHLKVARKFFVWLVQTQRRKTNPFAEVEIPRQGEVVSKNVLTPSQMGRLLGDLARFDLAVGSKGRRRRYRVHVIVEFLYATGLRIEEACSIEASQLDLEHRMVRLSRGKGGKPRTVFLTGYAAQVMEGYLKQGREAALAQSAKQAGLFGAGKNRILMLVNAELRERCESLGLPVITTHGLRHSLGTHLLSAGCDMRHIQVILGHESLATTQIYTRVNKDELKQSLDEFHPRKWNPREGENGA